MKLKKSSRTIKKIILHSTATPEGRVVSTNKIRHWHMSGNGWSDIGYHYVCELNGKIVEGRDVNRNGAHTRGENGTSIGIVYVGGCDENMEPKDTRNNAQKKGLEKLISKLMKMYPDATLHGHNEFSNKACPSFDVQEEYDYLINPKVEEKDEE